MRSHFHCTMDRRVSTHKHTIQKTPARTRLRLIVHTSARSRKNEKSLFVEEPPHATVDRSHFLGTLLKLWHLQDALKVSFTTSNTHCTRTNTKRRWRWRFSSFLNGFPYSKIWEARSVSLMPSLVLIGLDYHKMAFSNRALIEISIREHIDEMSWPLAFIKWDKMGRVSARPKIELGANGSKNVNKPKHAVCLRWLLQEGVIDEARGQHQSSPFEVRAIFTCRGRWLVRCMSRTFSRRSLDACVYAPSLNHTIFSYFCNAACTNLCAHLSTNHLYAQLTI